MPGDFRFNLVLLFVALFMLSVPVPVPVPVAVPVLLVGTPLARLGAAH